MISALAAPRRHLFSHAARIAARARPISTLANNPHIHVFPDPSPPSPSQKSYLLSLLPTDPPTESLAIGRTSALPPTPTSLAENPHFLTLLQAVLAQHATRDPAVHAAALAFASSSASPLSPTGAPAAVGGARGGRHRGRSGTAQETRAPVAPGGFVHVSDQRNPPDWGRIAYPEDIFGSVQVDGAGEFVGERGGYQPSGTYRVCTNEGVLGLSEYLRGKVLEELRRVEEGLKGAGKA